MDLLLEIAGSVLGGIAITVALYAALGVIEWLGGDLDEQRAHWQEVEEMLEEER